jgi:hypothetical protein
MLNGASDLAMVMSTVCGWKEQGSFGNLKMDVWKWSRKRGGDCQFGRWYGHRAPGYSTAD